VSNLPRCHLLQKLISLFLLQCAMVQPLLSSSRPPIIIRLSSSSNDCSSYRTQASSSKTPPPLQLASIPSVASGARAILISVTSLYAYTIPSYSIASHSIPYQNDVACGLSAVFVLYLIHRCNRRKAAVGRIELRATLTIYIVTCILQLLTTGSIFAQGSDALTILTAVHAGAVASFFWCLVANALVATQVGPGPV
jgi:hypothetical protein